jgi:hypothetical protein
MDKAKIIEAPVKRVLFVLSSVPISKDLFQRLEDSFGTIDYQGSEIPFKNTGYYEREFGTPLYRLALSFEGLASAHELAYWKRTAVELEKEFVHLESRVYNLDIGYMDTNKLVLGSLKQGNEKIYLGQGVYADMLLKYAKGVWTSFDWAFVDFRNNCYHKDLERIREKYKLELKK